MNNKSLKTLIISSLLAAITCAATLAIRIPTPTNGYVNCGDVAVLLSGFILGPFWGALAAGLGSFLADIFAGYIVFAPATLIIKGSMAAMFSCLIIVLSRWIKQSHFCQSVSAIIAETFMVLAYFCYEATVLGLGGGAAVGIIGNTVQGAFGAIVVVFIIQVLQRVAPNTLNSTKL